MGKKKKERPDFGTHLSIAEPLEGGEDAPAPREDALLGYRLSACACQKPPRGFEAIHPNSSPHLGVGRFALVVQTKSIFGAQANF